METIQDNNDLLELLDDLQAGKFEAIEFGEPAHPAGHLSGIRIRYISTMGGKQFRLCQLSRLMECGGIYEQTAIQALAMANVLHERYTRPAANPWVREVLATRVRSDLKWFGIKALPVSISKSSLPPLPGEITITLNPTE